MMGVIDLHSHLLPGIDDGSDSIEQTKNMIRIAKEEGIDTIIATPHFQDGRNNNLAAAQEILIKIQEEISQTEPDMKLYLGSEIYYSYGAIKQLKDKLIPSMAGSRYVLVEFSPAAEFKYIKNALYELILEGFWPIIAHLERYTAFYGKMELIYEVMEQGAYIQVNAMSIMKESGRAYYKMTKKLLKNRLIHFIGTDSHSDGVRAPKINKCVAFIERKYGREYANVLFRENPRKVIENEII